jgi:hypothetical protein
MFDTLSNFLPSFTSLSPVTMVGIGIGALGALLYLVTRVPELLLVVATSIIYAVIPLFSH